ncbi:MAG TPA: DUF86 domain-containing protein [Waddliaceae bacterium]
MKPPLSDELRVRHVLDAIKEIESYLHNISIEEFLANSEKRFATIKQLEIIGEACARISPAIKEKHPEVEWNNIIGFRNISIHEYFGVNFQIVWQIAQNDLTMLKQQFSKILVGFEADKRGKPDP